ncbi:U-box domain [seawater metagenome]|uniref:U-box domain n=1 Tax=seawater metagenome TaxID=1561972 RepID=A0A5E8CLA1_9ZZZZ
MTEYYNKYLKYKSKCQNIKRKIINNILKGQTGGAAQAIYDELTGPITHAIMVDPVIASDGHTYERTAILEVIRRGGVSPLTREALTPVLLPNRRLKNIIERLVADRLLSQEVIDEYNQERRQIEQVPAQANPIPAQANPIPAQANPIPAQANPIPAQANPIPAQANPIPAQVALAQVQDDLLPRLLDNLRNLLNTNLQISNDNRDNIIFRVLNNIDIYNLEINIITNLIDFLREVQNFTDLSYDQLIQQLDIFFINVKRNELRIFLENNTDLINDDIDNLLNNTFTYIERNNMSLSIIQNIINLLDHNPDLIRLDFNEINQEILEFLRNFIIPIQNYINDRMYLRNIDNNIYNIINRIDG